MLKTATDLREMWEHAIALLGGALLSLVMPIGPIMWVLGIMAMADVYLGWRICRRKCTKDFSRGHMMAAVWRSADYFCVLLVTSAFQARFMAYMPLVYCMGLAIGVIELKRLNEKLIELHDLDLFRVIFDRLKGRSNGARDQRGSGGEAQ